MTSSRLLRILRTRVRALFGARAQDAALDDEMSFHLEQLIQEKRASGLDARAARDAALREFGNVALFRESSRDARGLRWLHDLRQDARYGLRTLRRSPGFTLVAMASLAIALGAATAVSGAMLTIRWRTVPFADADRLVVIRTTSAAANARDQGVALKEFLAFRERSRTFDGIGMSFSSPRTIGPEADIPYGERLPSQAFTPGLFELLGVTPLRGRVFGDAPTPFSAAAKVMLISHRLWQTRYHGADDVIGRVVPSEGGSRTIIGVLPPSFRLHDPSVDIWIPLILSAPPGSESPVGRPFTLFARLRSGVPAAAAQADLQDISDDLELGMPERFRGRVVRVSAMSQALYGWTNQPMFTLFCGIAILLAIACANVSGLLLARGTTRQRELWVRLTLGAGRGRIARQLLAEGLLLGVGGAAAGVPVAIASLYVLTLTLGPPPGLPRVPPMAFDAPFVGILVLLATIAGLAIGALPALVAARRTAQPGDSGLARPALGDLHSTRARGVLVACQIAMAMVLLVVAGLFVNSLVRVLGRDLGFQPAGLASFQVIVEPHEFVKRIGSDGFLGVFELTPLAADTIDRVHRRLREVPGIERVGGLTYQPVNSLVLPRLPVSPVPVPGGSSRHSSSLPIVTFIVTPDVFAALRTPILRGREVSDADADTAPPVVVLNESAERLLFPGKQAVGERLVVDLHPNAPVREVIGVVADVPTRRRLEADPIIYLPSRQTPATFRGGGANFFGHMTFVVRYAGDESAVVEAARRAVAEIEPGRPLVEVGVVRRWLDGRMAELSNYVLAILAFGLLAGALAAMGVYGITSFAVAARTREIGIRRALGADARAVIAAVGWRSIQLTLIGLVVGLAMALGVTRFLTSQIVGVSVTDPVTFAAAAVLLTAIGFVACLIPTRRALSVEPASVLRND